MLFSLKNNAKLMQKLIYEEQQKLDKFDIKIKLHMGFDS